MNGPLMQQCRMVQLRRPRLKPPYRIQGYTGYRDSLTRCIVSDKQKVWQKYDSMSPLSSSTGDPMKASERPWTSIPMPTFCALRQYVCPHSLKARDCVGQVQMSPATLSSSLLLPRTHVEVRMGQPQRLHASSAEDNIPRMLTNCRGCLSAISQSSKNCYQRKDLNLNTNQMPIQLHYRSGSELHLRGGTNLHTSLPSACRQLPHQTISRCFCTIPRGDGVSENDVAAKGSVSERGRSRSQPDIRTKSVALEQLKPVTSVKIKEFLQKHDLAFKNGHSCYITSCPRYVKRRMKMSEVNKLFVNMTTGYFVCLSCKRSGTWSNFMDNTETLLTDLKEKRRLQDCFKKIPLRDENLEASRVRQVWSETQALDSLGEEVLDEIKEHLQIQELAEEALDAYRIRASPGNNGLVAPQYGLDGSLIGLRSITMETVKHKGSEREQLVNKTIPRVDYNGLFGLNLTKSSQTEAVLVASEFDAVAVYQATGRPALALPKGDSVLPQKVLPILEQFGKITLWLGGDMRTWETTKQFARKLNESRCHLIRPNADHPGPLVALKAGLDLKKILQAAKPVQHKSIISFRNIRHDVFMEMSESEQVAGVKWKRYPQLNNLLKGHRRGELTVFTGPTGSGKTTFISDYSLDLCQQGVNTMWGSFEINNIRLMKTMLMQFSQINIVKHIEAYDFWADQFEHLPMYFMTFHGQENIRKVVETMSHAVYVHDIAHVVVDNLQFMMGTDGLESGNMAADRYLKQDQIISAFRKFATNMNCHVTLVIHPRKERETDELSVSSIFGSAKASQEADNVMLLQDRRAVSLRGRKYIQVAKNRYDGDLGIMLLKFNKETKSFSTKFKDAKDEKGSKQASDGDLHLGKDT